MLTKDTDISGNKISDFFIPPFSRINRTGNFVISTVYTLILLALYFTAVNSVGSLQYNTYIKILQAYVILIYFPINLILGIGRFNDMNLSGWFMILYFISIPIPIFCLVLSSVVCFYPGSKGANRFGNKPRKATDLETVIAFFLGIPTILTYAYYFPY